MSDEIEKEKNKNYENGISFIVPCRNEEQYIKDTVIEITKSVVDLVDYEILIIDDCSSDQTGNVVRQLRLNNPKIKLLNNNIHLGYGGSFIKALKLAKKEFINLMPGDNAISSSEMKKMLTDIYNYDLIISIIENKRAIHRRIFSKIFTIIVNIVFRDNTKYYNGLGVIRTKVINSLNITSKSPFFMAEIILKILKLKLKYDQRHIIHIEKKFGKSSIFNFKTIVQTISDLIKIRITY